MGACATTCENQPFNYGNKDPGLGDELKRGANLLAQFYKVHLTFCDDIGEVWKVKNKVTSATYSMHERSKNLLYQRKEHLLIIKENRILQKLNSPSIINIKYACQDQYSLIMITDPIHSRLSYHIKQNRAFTEDQIKYVTASLILALEYIHSKQIIHRDIRPENVVFDSAGKVKLTHFWLAREYDENIDNSIDQTGTNGYMAPEVLFKKPQGYQVDYYGLGIVLYELAALSKLFEGTNMEITKRIEFLDVLNRRELTSKCSAKMVRFISQLLKFDPKERLGLSVDEVKGHEWFEGFDWKGIGKKEGGLKSVIGEEETESLRVDREGMNERERNRMISQNLYIGYQYGLEESVESQLKKNAIHLI